MCSRIIILSFNIFFILSLNAQDFIDVTSQMGIVHTYTTGELGAGISFMDFNQDGLDDISIASVLDENVHFYQNNGTDFTKITLANVNIDCESKQILWVDYDNDGDKDLFLTCHNEPNRLFANDGNMNMTDITVQSGLDLEEESTFGACFGDYDKDGDLDLYILNRSFDGQRNSLFYKNNGNGTFTESTQNVGIEDIDEMPFGAAFIDYNDDSWFDILIYMDKNWGNVLFQNNGDGTFSDLSVFSGFEVEMEAMSITPGDFDNDDDIDVFISNDTRGNALFVNQGDGTFVDEGSSTGVLLEGFFWGGNFLDVDNDADLDLYVSGEINPTSSNNSQLLINNNNGTFSHPTIEILNDTQESHGNAVGDYNNDGFPDIVVNNYGGTPSKIWKNTNNTNNWLKLKLAGTASNRDGIGSKIEVYVNGMKQLRYTYCGEGYLAQNADHELFGLGSNLQVDSIIVTWTSGIVDRVENISANQEILIIEGDHPVGINEIANHYFEAIYEDNLIRVTFNDGSHVYGLINLINASGEIVYEKSIKKYSGENEFNIPTSRYSTGIYFLRVVTDKFDISKKTYVY